MAHDVFISYSHHDKAAADAVCAKLELHQIRCWIAPRDVVPGIEWADCIIDAINSTRVMVLVFSKNANDSPQIHKEVERAVNKGVIIVPLRIEDVIPTRSLEYFMSNVHWLDALTPPLEQYLDHLAGTVKMLVERTESGDINEQYSGIRPVVPTRSDASGVRLLGIIPIARRRFYLTAFAITVVAVISSVLLWRHIYRPLEFPRLAVIGPTNDTKDPKYDYLTTLVADIVSADLSQPKGLNAVPPQDIVQMRQDISIPSNICSGDVHPVPLQNIFAASYLIFGSFRENSGQPGSNIHIALCLLDRNGKLLGNPFEQDRDEATIRIFSELAADYFRRTIGDSRLAPQDFDKIFPQDPVANRLYFQGLADMRVFDAAKARDALQAAAQKENSNPLIHSALSQAWSMLRMNKEAKDEANAASDAASHLPAALPLEFNTGIKAAAAEINKQWPRALDLYDLLYESYPERLDLGLKLARLGSVTASSTSATAAFGPTNYARDLCTCDWRITARSN